MWKSGLILLSISTSIFAAFLCEKGKLLMTVTGETVDPGQTYRQICGFLQDWQGVWQRPALRAWPESGIAGLIEAESAAADGRWARARARLALSLPP